MRASFSLSFFLFPFIAVLFFVSFSFTHSRARAVTRSLAFTDRHARTKSLSPSLSLVHKQDFSSLSRALFHIHTRTHSCSHTHLLPPLVCVLSPFCPSPPSLSTSFPLFPSLSHLLSFFSIARSGLLARWVFLSLVLFMSFHPFHTSTLGSHDFNLKSALTRNFENMTFVACWINRSRLFWASVFIRVLPSTNVL